MKKFIVVLSVISILFLAGCNSNEKINDNNEQNDNTEQSVINQNQEKNDENQNIASEAETIKSLLVSGGSWSPVSAYDLINNKESDLFEVYGSGIRYGGTLDFKEDGTFTKTIGVYAENYMGEYEIDVDKNVINFTFETGMKMEGSYQYRDGEIISVDIIEGSDDWQYRVTLMKK